METFLTVVVFWVILFLAAYGIITHLKSSKVKRTLQDTKLKCLLQNTHRIITEAPEELREHVKGYFSFLANNIGMPLLGGYINELNSFNRKLEEDGLSIDVSREIDKLEGYELATLNLKYLRKERENFLRTKGIRFEEWFDQKYKDLELGRRIETEWKQTQGYRTEEYIFNQIRRLNP